MPLPAAVPIIAAGIGGLMSLIGASENRKQQRRDEAYLRWYNEPKQQIQRLQEAGLSPSYMYGAGGQANQAPDPSVQQVIDPNLMPHLVEMALLPLQKKKLEAEVRKEESDADVYEFEAWKAKQEKQYLEQYDLIPMKRPDELTGEMKEVLVQDTFNRFLRRQHRSDYIQEAEKNIKQQIAESLEKRDKEEIAKITAEIAEISAREKGIQWDNKMKEYIYQNRNLLEAVRDAYRTKDPDKIYDAIQRIINIRIFNKD